MGILYGYMIAHLLPSITAWMALPTALVRTELAVPPLLRAAQIVMAAGVAASGLRDLYASFEGPRSEWPWERA
jgi:hypothetical protein